MVYKFNNLKNAKGDLDRDVYELIDVSVKDKPEFKNVIEDVMDKNPPGVGYVLIKWDNKLFILEKDANNPHIPYTKREIHYHPLLSKFN